MRKYVKTMNRVIRQAKNTMFDNQRSLGLKLDAPIEIKGLS